MVWWELVRLLEEPALIQAERETDLQRRRQVDLRSERERLERAGARLVTAYQEELITLDELRSRMPAIHSRKRVLEAELEAIESAAGERELFSADRGDPGEFPGPVESQCRDTRSHRAAEGVTLACQGSACRGRRDHDPPFHTNDRRERLLARQPASNSSRQSPEPQGYLLRWRSHQPLALESVPAPRAGPVV